MAVPWKIEARGSEVQGQLRYHGHSRPAWPRFCLTRKKTAEHSGSTLRPGQPTALLQCARLTLPKKKSWGCQGGSEGKVLPLQIHRPNLDPWNPLKGEKRDPVPQVVLWPLHGYYDVLVLHAEIHTCRTYTHTHMYSHTHTYVPTYTLTHIYTHVLTWTCTCVPIHICMHIHTRTQWRQMFLRKST